MFFLSSFFQNKQNEDLACEIESELDVTVNEICMVSLLEEIELIVEHLIMTDHRRDNIHGSIQGYIDRAVEHLMSDSLPLSIACSCRPEDDFECRYHIPHLEYLVGYAAAMIAVDVNNNGWGDSVGGVQISSERIMNTFKRILHVHHDPYHRSLREGLEVAACSLIMQFKEC